ASRSIAAAPDPGAAAQQLRDEINSLRQPSARQSDLPHAIRELADDLLFSHCVRFGEFTLKSGQQSPIYLDLRRLVSYPMILKRVAQAYARIVRELQFDRIAGIPYAALPIATATAL